MRKPAVRIVCLFLSLVLVVTAQSPHRTDSEPPRERPRITTDGNQLLKQCAAAMKDHAATGEEQWDGAFCYGYISAVSDAAHLIRERTTRGKNVMVIPEAMRFCIPSNVPNDQVLRIVFKWLESNPEALHFPASDDIAFALHDAFPYK